MIKLSFEFDYSSYYVRNIKVRGTKLDAKDETNEIISKAKADGTYMKAPNGKPTKLNERQWVQVRTKAFKDWFGDWEKDPENASKVVDENGEPMVVYHNTYSYNNITIFDKEELGGNTDHNASNAGYAATSHLGFWLSNHQISNYDDFINCFINIKEPLRLNSLVELVFDISSSTDRDINAEERNFDDENETLSYSEYVQILANDYLDNIENSSDGIIVKDEEFGGYSYVAFKPNQIKTATDNNGDFSRENDDIRY